MIAKSKLNGMVNIIIGANRDKNATGKTILQSAANTEKIIKNNPVRIINPAKRIMLINIEISKLKIR